MKLRLLSAVALLWITAVPAVFAATDPIIAPFSGAGSNIATTIDTNNDGITGFIANTYGFSSLGTFTATNYNESLAPVGVNTAHCPEAEEVPLAVVNTVFTFQDSSQIMEKLVSGYFCLRPDNTFTLSAATQIIGGSGRFNGITGTIQTNAQGTVVFAVGSGATLRPILLQETFDGTMTISYARALLTPQYR